MLDDSNLYSLEPRDARRRPKLHPFELDLNYDSQRIMPRARPGDRFIETGATLEQVEETIRSNEHVHGAFFDAFGIFARVTSLHPNRIEMAEFYGLSERVTHTHGGATFTHNHPKNSGPLSGYDFGMAAWYSLREIRAVQANGQTFSARMKGLRRNATRMELHRAWEPAIQMVRYQGRTMPRIARVMEESWREALKWTAVDASDDALFENVLRLQTIAAQDFNIELTWQKPNP